MAIMKHTFEETSLSVINGEIVETEGEIKEYCFSLRMNGLKLFEEEYGKSLLKTLTKMASTLDLNKLKKVKDDLSFDESILFAEGILEEDFLKALASASYVKIENNQLINNEATLDEFKKSYAYFYLCNDIDFIIKLLEMAFDNVFEKNKKNKTSGGGARKN